MSWRTVKEWFAPPLPEPQTYTELAPPRPGKHEFGPEHVRNTDEWGNNQTLDQTVNKHLPIGRWIESLSVLPLTKIEEIKLLMKSLTYGEMIEMCQQIDKAVDHLTDKPSDENFLPKVLHRWAST